MAYDFTENEFELEPQPSSARGGFPPRKGTVAGVLDPSIPPNTPSSSSPAVSIGLIFRIVAGVVLAGLVAIMFLMLFARL